MSERGVFFDRATFGVERFFTERSMANAFGKHRALKAERHTIFTIELPELGLILQNEEHSEERELVLVVRSIDGTPLTVYPSAANSIGVTIGAVVDPAAGPPPRSSSTL